jgi:penicillin-binding protein 2
LQVAQAMAGIANGGALPKLHLIRQVQDTRGRVVQAPLPERKNWLGVDEKAVEIVREGMSDVVNSGGGTGRSAGLSYTTLCGKTGTAQWGDPRKQQRLAWFAGFLPEDNPRYSFAVLYEGRPGETVSGGRMAAPMVKKFFEGIKDDIKDAIAPPKKALIVVDESEGSVVPAAGEVEEGAEGEINNPSGVKPLRAIPVEPLETEESVEEPVETPVETVEQPSPQRAIRVSEDEIIDQGVEEP